MRTAPLRPFASLLPRLWFMPVVGALAAVAISVATLLLDSVLTEAGVALPIVAAGPQQIGTLYSVIAVSILNLLALVFTILVVVLQLTSSQYSHRALRTLLQDRQSRVTLGIFVATFLHALIVLSALGTAASDQRVAGVSVASTLILSVVSIAAFLFFIDHITQSIRVTSIITEIGKETRGTIDRLHPEDGAGGGETGDPTPDGAPQLVPSPDPGIVSSIQADGLVEACRRAGAVVEMVPAVGDFVPRGAPLLRVYRHETRPDNGPPSDLARFISLSAERSMEVDVGFGLRQLVDIVERALSPGVIDPTIAVHALDQIHDLLRRMSRRPLSNGMYADEEGRVRLKVPRPSWDDYLSLAVDEPRHYGGGSVQVMRRLRAMLEDLLDVARPERREPIRRQLRLLDGAIERHFPDPDERAIASRADPQGQGSPRASEETSFAPPS